MNKTYDKQYVDLVEDILENGEVSENRTGVNTLFKIGHLFEIDCSKNFPLLTTKRVSWKSAFAEMLGFIRAYDDAKAFRKLGCKVWDKDANENQDWLDNPHRGYKDYLGPIYGVQWRHWDAGHGLNVDQLQMVVNDLSKGIDNRREIVSAWNPGEMEFVDNGEKYDSLMALPPCHVFMQFSLVNNKSTVDLFVYQRSWDIGLGNPFNIAQYAFLLHLISHITNKKVGILRYFGNNCHIYENHINALTEQIQRDRKKQPKISFKYLPNSLEELYEEKYDLIPEWVEIKGYNPHPAIKMEMVTTPKRD